MKIFPLASGEIQVLCFIIMSAKYTVNVGNAMTAMKTKLGFSDVKMKLTRKGWSLEMKWLLT